MKRALLIAIFVILAAAFCLAQAPAPVKVESGLVRRAIEDGLTVYRGIPFIGTR
jgi:hypothetical protein